MKYNVSEEFQFRWLNIKGIDATFPISIMLFLNHLNKTHLSRKLTWRHLVVPHVLMMTLRFDTKSDDSESKKACILSFSITDKICASTDFTRLSHSERGILLKSPSWFSSVSGANSTSGSRFSRLQVQNVKVRILISMVNIWKYYHGVIYQGKNDCPLTQISSNFSTPSKK